jgi:hypothetical protein
LNRPPGAVYDCKRDRTAARDGEETGMSAGTLPRRTEPVSGAARANGVPLRPKGMAIRLANGFVIPDWVRDHESFRR